MLVAGLTLAAFRIIRLPPSARPTCGEWCRTMTAGIESCAGGVSESLTALQEIQFGASHDTKTAVSIAATGAANCSPANSMPMDDLVQYQPPESLASFHLDQTVNDVVTWGFPDAQRVQADVGDAADGQHAGRDRAATAALARDQRALDAERAVIESMINMAQQVPSAGVAPPSLPNANQLSQPAEPGVAGVMADPGPPTAHCLQLFVTQTGNRWGHVSAGT